MNRAAIGVLAALAAGYTIAAIGQTTPQPDRQAWTACVAAPTRACVLAEALRSARSLIQSASRYEAVDAIVTAHMDARRYAEAFALSDLIEDDTTRSLTLARMAYRQAREGQVPEALRAARAVPVREWRVVALGNIAEAQKGGQAGDIFDEALGVARWIWSDAARSPALRSIAISLGRAGRTAEAMRIAMTIGMTTWRSKALLGIAEAMAAAGAGDEAAETFKASLREARSIPDAVGQIYDLRDIGAAQAKAGLGPDAAATFSIGAAIGRSFGDAGSRDTFLAVIAEAQARAGLTSDALSVLDVISMDWSRIRVLVAAAETLAQRGHPDAGATYDLARASAEAGREAARPYGLAFIADSQRVSGFKDQAAATLARAEEVARALPTEQARSGALAAVASSHAAGGGVATARRIALSIASAETRDIVMGAIVASQVKAGLLDDAAQSVLAVTDPMTRAFPLRLLADARAKAGRIAEALQATETMPPIHYQRPYALGTIAAAMRD